jgi:hypothetical protein
MLVVLTVTDATLYSAHRMAYTWMHRDRYDSPLSPVMMDPGDKTGAINNP